MSWPFWSSGGRIGSGLRTNGGAGDVGRRHRSCGQAASSWLVAVGGLVAVRLAAELDAADDVVAAAAGAVVVPLAVDEPAGDRDGAALGQVLGAGVGLGAEGGDVDEHRLVLLVVDREAQLADLAVVVELLEDRVGGQISDQGDRVNCGS